MQHLTDARYDTVAEFVASLDEFRNPSRSNTATDAFFYRALPDYMTDFYGADCATVADVKTRMREGWQDGLDAVSALLTDVTAIDTAPVDRRRRLSRSDAGDSLDMGAVYRGRLDIAWTRATRRPCYAPQKIDLVVNCSCSGSYDSTVVQWRGVAAVALADRLEASGFMVRIVVGFGGPMLPDNEERSCRVTVKDYDKPLDICTAATITLPGFYRGLGLSWAVRHAKGYVNSSIGIPKSCIIDDGEIAISHETCDRRTALAFVNAQIAKLNATHAAA